MLCRGRFVFPLCQLTNQPVWTVHNAVMQKRYIENSKNHEWQYYLSPHQCQHVAEVLPQFMITCAKEVMFSLYLFVCVFVSQQYYVKTTWLVFTKFDGKVAHRNERIHYFWWESRSLYIRVRIGLKMLRLTFHVIPGRTVVVRWGPSHAPQHCRFCPAFLYNQLKGAVGP